MSTSYWLKFGNSTCGFNGKGVGWEEPPIVLPPYTIRLRFTDGVTPTFAKGTGTQVSSSPNVWDLTYTSAWWDSLLSSQMGLLEVLAANATGVTNMDGMFANCYYLTAVSLFDTSSVTYMGRMFEGCRSLTSVPLFDTSSVTDMGNMFYGCTSLTTVPLFDTSSVTGMGSMFQNCTSLVSVPLFNTANVAGMTSMFANCTSLTSVPLFDTSSVRSMDYTFYECRSVQSGALALYQQASSQVAPPPTHSDCFKNCGRDTTTGTAELAQIPSSWGGLGA